MNVNRRKAIRKQVEYYFCDRNYDSDKFLQQTLEKNEQFLPLKILMTFNKIRELTGNVSDLQSALMLSKFLKLNETKSGVNRVKRYTYDEYIKQYDIDSNFIKFSASIDQRSMQQAIVLSLLEKLQCETFIKEKKCVLIGSRALRRNVTQLYREPKDFDIIATPSFLIDFFHKVKHQIEEIKIVENGANTTPKLIFVFYNKPTYECKILCSSNKYELNSKILIYQYCKDHINTEYYDELLKKVYIAPIELLFALKITHMYWPIHWFKTMEDIQFITERYPLIQNIVNDNENLQNIILVHMEELETNKPHPKVNLNMENDQFFQKSENKLKRKIDHDELHQLVAFYDKPLFTKFKKDLTKALIDRDLFEKATFYFQIQLVQEEIMALTLERFMLAEKTNLAIIRFPQRAYLSAYELLCTRLSKGWFREFALKHYSILKFVPKDLSVIIDKHLSHLLKDQKESTNEDDDRISLFFEEFESRSFQIQHYIKFVFSHYNSNYLPKELQFIMLDYLKEEEEEVEVQVRYKQTYNYNSPDESSSSD